MSEEDLLIALLKSVRNLAELYKSKSSNSKIKKKKKNLMN